MINLCDLTKPSVEAIPQFFDALENARKAQHPSDWRSMVQRDGLLRMWRYFLVADPYTRWGLLKPRGYPGDATLMDFAYGHASVRDDIAKAGPMGEAIYRHTSGAEQSASARQRIDLIAKALKRQAQTGRFRVASYACGHARELEQLSPDAADQIDLFMAIDADDRSLDEARRSAGGIAFEGFKRNVIKDELSDLPHAELVYSLGLFDYLKDDHAGLVIRRMFDQTAPGGITLLANLAPTAANLGYCEAIMDWWMIPRSAADLLRVAALAVNPEEGAAEVEQHGCFNYLFIRKV